MGLKVFRWFRAGGKQQPGFGLGFADYTPPDDQPETLWNLERSCSKSLLVDQCTVSSRLCEVPFWCGGEGDGRWQAFFFSQNQPCKGSGGGVRCTLQQGSWAVPFAMLLPGALRGGPDLLVLDGGQGGSRVIFYGLGGIAMLSESASSTVLQAMSCFLIILLQGLVQRSLLRPGNHKQSI